ncbi:MAG: sugar kinase, partial [Candidatus Diapherotrites archaeon]|nr:sugar kinase [Candidatus Diapherotrites archaeon]
MIEVLTAGSVAFDSIQTPFGTADHILGGSATYAALACRFFAAPAILSIVGNDFPSAHIRMLQKKGIDTRAIHHSSQHATFHWKGKYEFDLNTAITLQTHLNAFTEFSPTLPESHRRIPCLFLGNISPSLQMQVLKQMKRRPKIVMADTMNYYIQQDPAGVKKMIEQTDMAIMNDAEARM